ncbi:MAG: hypothetical protein AAF821_07295 [Cyanobacteria bacterium P01_D01_bin.156]
MATSTGQKSGAADPRQNFICQTQISDKFYRLFHPLDQQRKNQLSAVLSLNERATVVN